MILHENRLLADDSIVCWQTILMKYHILSFFRKSGKMSQILLSAAVVIGTLRVNKRGTSDLGVIKCFMLN